MNAAAKRKNPRAGQPSLRAYVRLMAKGLFSAWAKAEAYRQKAEGRDVGHADLTGDSEALADVVYWFLRRSDADRRRIQAEGRALRVQERGLGDSDPLSFGQDERSIYEPPAPSPNPAIVEPRGGSARGPAQRRRKRGEDRPRQGEPGRHDARPVAEH